MLRYIEPFLEARRAGLASDHIHLGWWADPARAGDDWEAAQERLCARVLDLAGISDGQAVLDAACGIGGALRAIRARSAVARLVGLNIDPRQLALCPGAEAGVERVEADATALPFPAASFDRVICIEAQFHFASRAAFLAEAARALRPGGRLALSDILLDPDALPAGARAGAEAALRRDYGPWPAPWLTPADLRAALAGAGFRDVEIEDATAETLPSYRWIAPDPAARGAGALMRALQTRGALRYVFARAGRA